MAAAGRAVGVETLETLEVGVEILEVGVETLEVGVETLEVGVETLEVVGVKMRTALYRGPCPILGQSG